MIKVYFFTESPINKIYSRKIYLEYISQNFQSERTTFLQNKEYFKKSKNYFFEFSKLSLIKNKFILLKKLFKIKIKKFYSSI